MPRINWTPYRIKKLARLVSEGKSNREIANEFHGATPGSIGVAKMRHLDSEQPDRNSILARVCNGDMLAAIFPEPK